MKQKCVKFRTNLRSCSPLCIVPQWTVATCPTVSPVLPKCQCISTVKTWMPYLSRHSQHLLTRRRARWRPCPTTLWQPATHQPSSPQQWGRPSGRSAPEAAFAGWENLWLCLRTHLGIQGKQRSQKGIMVTQQLLLLPQLLPLLPTISSVTAGTIVSQSKTTWHNITVYYCQH